MNEAEVQSNNATPSSKFCVDCEYIATSHEGWEQFKCRAPQNKEMEVINLITGQNKIIWYYDTCSQARHCKGIGGSIGGIPVHRVIGCGLEGTWFKQKEYIVPDDSKIESMKAGKKPQITLDMI